MKAPLLFGESFSPWTQKARWALEHCGVRYRYSEYTPTLSEPSLRLHLRQWSGMVSVPVMLAGNEVLRGSWEIACYAASFAGDGRLGVLSDVVDWNTISETALTEGRTRVVRCVLASNPALEEALPWFVPSALRTPLRLVARDAARRLDRKYAHLVVPGSLRNALLKLRSGLAASQSGYLLDRFSYADITMAVVLETIRPIARTEPPLGSATRRCWSDDALAEEFDDLLSWRSHLARSSITGYSQLHDTC